MSTKYHQTEGFKFPAAGLIGLDAGTKASVSKFLRQRERELNTIETVFIMCINGPFHGQSIELQPTGESGAHRSAEFIVGAWRGYYLGSKWVSTLEADAPAPEAIAAPLPRPKINCDLPAKGFDQLRDLLGEMSINPLERETTIKTRFKTARFNYGRTNDFGNEITEFSPVGTYRCEIVQLDNFKRIKKIKPSIKYKIIRATSFQQGAMAMDDFGDLFITQPRGNEREEMTEKRQFVTYKIGRTSYTIPATFEAVERLAAKILKIKKWFSDKMLALSCPARAAVVIQPAAQVAPMATIPTAPAVQPAPVTIEAPAAVLPKIEQPAKPLATTCNPEAARLRAKATICRHANRPAWAKILEDKADALDRVDPPEPPPCKHKNKMQRQRPRKTACTRLAKIRHPARHFDGQKYGEPIRQNLRPPTSEPPAIKPVTPPTHFYQTNQTERLTPWPALNLHPVTHQQHLSRSKQNEATYPCPPPPSFAVSALQPGKTGKPAAFPCPPPFGTYSTSYWITQSCRTKTKQTEATHE